MIDEFPSFLKDQTNVRTVYFTNGIRYFFKYKSIDGVPVEEIEETARRNMALLDNPDWDIEAKFVPGDRIWSIRAHRIVIPTRTERTLVDDKQELYYRWKSEGDDPIYDCDHEDQLTNNPVTRKPKFLKKVFGFRRGNYNVIYENAK